LDTALDLKELQLWGQIAPPKFIQAVHKRSDGWEVQPGQNPTQLALRHNGKLMAQTPALGSIRSFTLPPQGEVRWITVAAGAGLALLDKGGRQLYRFTTPGLAHAVAPSPDGRYLATATSPQLLCVYCPENPTPLLTVFLTGAGWIAWAERG